MHQSLYLIAALALQLFALPLLAQNNAWTPSITLKDRSNFFPAGTHGGPSKPSDGWWVTPIHANLLADGDVLVTGWSRYESDYCPEHSGRQNGTSFIINPNQLETADTTLEIAPLNEMPERQGDVLYCSGHAPLADGRILFTGGARYKKLDLRDQDEFGLPYSRLFDPKTKSFTAIAEHSPGGPHPTAADRAQNDWSWYEQGMMWYPTNLRLPDGRMLVAGGAAKWAGDFDNNKEIKRNKSLVIFDAKALAAGRNPWESWVSHENAAVDLGIDFYDYIHMFLLPRPLVVAGIPRQVALYGGGVSARIVFLSLDPNVPEKLRLASLPNAVRPIASKLADAKTNTSLVADGVASSASNTTAVLLPSGEILVAGGGTSGKIEAQAIDVYDPYSDSWRLSLASGISRIRAASTLLPDGTVLITNGEDFWNRDDNVGDRRQPQIYDPNTGLVQTLPAWSDDDAIRGYHNISLLLKDGRILIGGGRTLPAAGGQEQFRIGCERSDLRLFTPPYLQKGSRPVVVSAPLQVDFGTKPFLISYSGPEPKSVALLAFGSHTHHFDQNQRYVKLDFKKHAAGVLEVLAPKDGQLAPPGGYNLFILSEQGVPSVGHAVELKLP